MKWEHVEAWALQALSEARASLESSEHGSERNRGAIAILKQLLDLPEAAKRKAERISDDLPPGMDTPPNHIV